MKKTSLLLGFIALWFNAQVWGQSGAWSVQMAQSMMQFHRDSIQVKIGKPATWDYEQGLLLKAIQELYHRTGDAQYFQYIHKNMLSFVNEQGEIRTYKAEEFNSDNITTGRLLLYLYQETGDQRFKIAAQTLRKQIQTQPRTHEGGFWHKQRYPNQMWLDGLYMLEPFYAEYGRLFNENPWSDIVLQFELMYKGALDPKTGLLFHAYDAARQQAWADKKTGQSPNFWGRSMGWYMMALVDVLDYIPAQHPSRKVLIQQLNALSDALLKIQDPRSHLWYQVPNFPGREGNYLEASCANMFVYAFAKGLRQGYLPEKFRTPAKNAYAAILKNFIRRDAQGLVHLEKTVSVGGLGGNPYRDGSYAYYLSEPLKTDDLKGVGPFILASLEMEIMPELKIGQGKKVVLDYYFNRESRKNKEGQMERFHYTWEDRKDPGFYLWGEQWKQLGASIDSLPVAPSLDNLRQAKVFIIVDPDSKKESPAPNYIQSKDIQVLDAWVKAGGTLLLMSNDTANVEMQHWNQLATHFGFTFGGPNYNMVQGKNWEQGAVLIPEQHPIFKGLKKIYIKEIPSLTLSKGAKSLLNHANGVAIAENQWGKGKVVCVVDPWFYNEYTNNRRIPLSYENFPAAKALASYLLKP